MNTIAYNILICDVLNFFHFPFMTGFYILLLHLEMGAIRVHPGSLHNFAANGTSKYLLQHDWARHFICIFISCNLFDFAIDGTNNLDWLLKSSVIVFVFVFFSEGHHQFEHGWLENQVLKLHL